MTQKPIGEDVFEVVHGSPRLIGGRRKSDGRIVFPLPRGGEASLYDRIPLSPVGELWSYTVQRFRPKSPPYAGDDDERSFKPYALGYITLPDELIVESRIEIDDFADLRIGMPMQLAIVPFRRDADGTEVVTYAFRPAA